MCVGQLILPTLPLPYVLLKTAVRRARAAAGEQQARVLGDVEAQFLAGLRRKDGRTVGLGL